MFASKYRFLQWSDLFRNIFFSISLGKEIFVHRLEMNLARARPQSMHLLAPWYLSSMLWQRGVAIPSAG